MGPARISTSLLGEELNGNALFFDRDRHCEALALLASENLNRGDFPAAFQYADRRCRLPKPGAVAYLLRSEATRRAGLDDFAAQDLARAIEIDPTDAMVKTLALRWGTPEQKLAAARIIVADAASDRDLLRSAVALMIENGAKVLLGLRRNGAYLTGWVAWAGASPLSMWVRAENERIFDIAPDPAHWLAGDRRSCAQIETPDENGALQSLDFLVDGVEAERFAPPSTVHRHEKSWRREPDTGEGKDLALTVIVPVYEDYEATRACLGALFLEGSRIATRVIVVDDASPNPQLRDWVDQQAALAKIRLIRNARNLGFAASVNKALALCPHGDVLLLNADALPPPSCLDRLAMVAYSAPDIGTVTPFSNNGEFTSFPEPFVVNPLGGSDEVSRLDAVAWRANGRATVDLPNGVGFCLYITRACLDAVGPLPEIYMRGYYEDVEFCLRAREKAFRNVCATGVYVGHAGARSFRAEKRRLVMRNLAVLERRFPGNPPEAAAFLKADPLRVYRGAIEALTPIQEETALLVCGEGASGLLAREEALKRKNAADEAFPLLCIFSSARNRIRLLGVEGAGPQSLSFSFDDAREFSAFRDYLAAANLQRIEIFDPLSLPEMLLRTLFKLRRRVDLVVADFEWVFPARSPAGGDCREPLTAGLCGPCAVALAPGETYQKHARRLKRRRALLSNAFWIRPLDRMSEIFARHIFGDAPVAPAPSLNVFQPAARRQMTAGGALAIIAPSPCALVDRLIVRLARDLLRRGESRAIIVLGQCLDDLAAMSPGNVFVAGKVETEEYERLLRQYEVCALMSPYRTRFFGRLDQLSFVSGLPKAYFDWTFGKLPPEDGDLSLDPRLCDAKAVTNVVAWLNPERPGSGER